MKLIYCEECGWLFQLIRKHTLHCVCEDEKAGKYLDNGITAVVTENAIVVGIDNNSFNDCVWRYGQYNPKGEKAFSKRVDFFFSGWIPTIPGEVIRVEDRKEVEEFPYEYEEAAIAYSSHPVSMEVGDKDV